MMPSKYPRTYHLPFSRASSDDKVMGDTKVLQETDVIITAKMDGECTSLYRDTIHARSMEEFTGEDRAYIKSIWAGRKNMIPEGYRVAGENLYARHTVPYENLRDYFYMYALMTETHCLSWALTEDWAHLLGLELVPVLYRGPWDWKVIQGLMEMKECEGDPIEGFVVRTASTFPLDGFSGHVGKYVHDWFADTVGEDGHWRSRKLAKNGLATMV